MTIETAEELRLLGEMLREARPLLKDLKRAKKEAEEVLVRMVKDEVQARIRAEVDAEVERLRAEMREGMEAAADRIQREFQRLSDHLMMVDSKSRKAGLPPLDQVITQSVTKALSDHVLESVGDDSVLQDRILGEIRSAFKRFAK